MFADTITVFNYHKGLWFANIIHGVDCGIISSANSTTLNGTTRNDSVIVLIHSDIQKHILADTALQYVPPKEYEQLEYVSGHITFKPRESFILLGEYNFNEQANDDDYESGFFDYINSKYDNVYMITSAAYFGLIPHFEIGAG